MLSSIACPSSFTKIVPAGLHGEVSVPADYSELGWLLITEAIISLIAPLVTILIVQSTVFRSSD